MDAPTYPPALRFVKPAKAPFEFSVDTVTIAELLSVPATRQLVFDSLPSLKFAVAAPQLKPHLRNFTLRDLAGFGAFPADGLPELDRKLRALPATARPPL